MEALDKNQNKDVVYIKTINEQGKTVWKSSGNNKYGQCGVGSTYEKITEPKTFFEGEICDFKFNDCTVYIKTIDDNGKIIWKSFGFNYNGQCGIESREKDVCEPKTFFEGEIYDFKFNNDGTVYIKTINEQGKIIWKSFGYNNAGQCGVGSTDEKITEPKTLFEGEIYEFKFKNNYTIYIKTINKQGKIIWKSFGPNEHGQCGVKTSKYVIHEPTNMNDLTVLFN